MSCEQCGGPLPPDYLALTTAELRIDHYPENRFCSSRCLIMWQLDILEVRLPIRRAIRCFLPGEPS